VPTLERFGVLVVVAVTSSFLASITVIPVIVKLFQPAFLLRHGQADTPSTGIRQAFKFGSLTLLLVVIYFSMPSARADEPLSGLAIMERLVGRDEGKQVSRDLKMELTAKSGTSRIQHTRGFRKYYGKEKRTVIFYLKPTNVKGTAFLTYDSPDPEVDDDQWLYLPALRKVRRISASNRGDYFLGTDLAYEEIKKENKVELSDYHFTARGPAVIEGIHVLVVEGIPQNDEISDELGYGKVVWHVDPETWMSRVTEFWDVNGNHLKTIRLVDVKKVDGIWTTIQLSVKNHKTSHSTFFTFSNIDYKTEIEDRVFEQSMLRRGL
jgi:hypothetical protein